MSEDIERTVVLEEDKAMINAAMKEIYDLLPGRGVESFDLEKADAEMIDAFRVSIDAAQVEAEKIEAMRLRVNYEFTRENLENISAKDNGYKTLQKIAITNHVKANQSGDALVEALLSAGACKSIKPVIQREKVFSRLAWARKKAEYPHPRQIAAREAETAAGGQ